MIAVLKANCLVDIIIIVIMGKATPRRPCKTCGEDHKLKVKHNDIFKVNATKTPKSNPSTRSRNSNRIHSKFSSNTKVKKSNQTSCRSPNNLSATSRKNQNPTRKTKPCGSNKSETSQATKSKRTKGPHQIDRVTSGSDELKFFKIRNSNGSKGSCESLFSSVIKNPSTAKIIKFSSSYSLPFLHTANIKFKRSKDASCRLTSKQKRKNKKPPRNLSRSIKSEILHVTKSNNSKLPLFGLNQIDNGSRASDETTKHIKSSPPRAQNIKQSDSSFEPCTSANFCPDLCGEVGSNRCRVSCGSLSKRSRMQKPGGNTQEPIKSYPRRCECAHKKRKRSSSPKQRYHLPRSSESPQSRKQGIPKIESNVEKKCAGELKYQRVDLSAAQSSIAENKAPEDTNKIPKLKGTFVLKPQNGKQFSFNSTKFAGTVTFTTEANQSNSNIDPIGPSSSAKAKRQRLIEEEDDAAMNNHYGRILMAHCRAAEVKQSCKQEEYPEDGEENDYEDSSECPKINTTCRETKSSRRLTVKKAALAGYFYRVNEK